MNRFSIGSFLAGAVLAGSLTMGGLALADREGEGGMGEGGMMSQMQEMMGKCNQMMDEHMDEKETSSPDADSGSSS